MVRGTKVLGKGVCTFKEADVTRAFKAAKKAGVDVQVEIDLEHKRMRITPVKACDSKAGTEENDWNSIYEQN
jgi:hypothetical protein